MYIRASHQACEIARRNAKGLCGSFLVRIRQVVPNGSFVPNWRRWLKGMAGGRNGKQEVEIGGRKR